MVEVSAGELVAQLGGELLGDGATRIRRIAPLESAARDSISFLSNPRLQGQLAVSSAGCVIVGLSMRERVGTRPSAIVSADPTVLRSAHPAVEAPHAPRLGPGVHPSAIIEPGARVAPHGGGRRVGLRGQRRDRRRCGDRCAVPHWRRHVVGDDTRLMAQVIAFDGCRIGARGVLHSGVVVGADGFGFAPDEGRWVKIHRWAQWTSATMWKSARTPASTAARWDTVIAARCEDRQPDSDRPQRALGAHTAMAACVGIAGSTQIGAHCTFGGGRHSRPPADRRSCACRRGRAGLALDPEAGPLRRRVSLRRQCHLEKNAATLRQLHALRGRLRALENKLP